MFPSAAETANVTSAVVDDGAMGVVAVGGFAFAREGVTFAGGIVHCGGRISYSVMVAMRNLE